MHDYPHLYPLFIAPLIPSLRSATQVLLVTRT